MINWYAGWALILTAFVTGGMMGLFFHRDDFLGGYASFRRRILRLGHIALAALGMLNVLYALSPMGADATTRARIASVAFLVGGITMPAVCFLTAWLEPFRYLFFIPVGALVIAVIQVLRFGAP